MAKKKHDVEVVPDRIAEERAIEKASKWKKTHTEHGRKPEAPKALDSGTKTLIVIFAVLVLALILIFSLRSVYQPKVITIDDLFQKTYQGEESDINYLYNGIAFIKYQGLWYADIQKQGSDQVFRISLHYGPRELQDIYLSGNPKTFNSYLAVTKAPSDPNQTAIYITFDPLSPELNYLAVASGELSLNLARALNVMPIAACTNEDSDACTNRPIMTCEQNTEAMIFLTYEYNKTDVRVANNCIIVNAKTGPDMVRSADRLIYTFYGIMPLDEKQAYVDAFARKTASTIEVEPGFYDGIGVCAWRPGELTIDVLDADNKIIATRNASISNEDKFMEHCTTKKPIVISLSADQLSSAKRLNMSFTNDRDATIRSEGLIQIK